MKSISQEEFFKKVAVNSEVVDLETVRNVFYGMVRTISRELKDKHTIKLPDWGEFYLLISKSRRSRDVNDGQIRVLPPKTTVKFKPDYKVKKYFYKWGEDDRTVL